jgi:L-alanine-DL-glutamate epimerase-like enolase superfamily enzyme
MRIDKIEAIAISIPLKKNFGGSTYDVKKRCTVVTRAHAGGFVSEVYNGDNREHGAEIVRLIHDVLSPLAIGEDIFAIERLWEKMYALTYAQGDRKVLLEAISCVDCAAWDLHGKALGKSVRQLLGGYRTQLPIISIGGYYVDGKTLADYGREIESYREAGMAGCKFKVGGLAPEEDFKRVEAARKAAGDDFIIVVDANRGWNVHDAIRFSRLIEPLNITWFEEPCHWHDDVALMARVRHATRIPVTAGQSEITSQGVRRMVGGGAVDFVNYDVSEGGGITDWRRAAALCYTASVRMAHHEEAQVAQHLLTAVPHGTYLECFADPDRDPVWQKMWLNRPAIKNGFATVADEPGLGIVLDQEMISRYRVA